MPVGALGFWKLGLGLLKIGRAGVVIGGDRNYFNKCVGVIALYNSPWGKSAAPCSY